MSNLLKAAAKVYRTVNYCIASAELYLHEADNR